MKQKGDSVVFPRHILGKVVSAACDAGQAILELYERKIEVEYKDDNSPLTEADRASNRIILAALAEVSDDPILSEESRHLPFAERRAWDRLWLVDPLDGTKEFLKRNGEFTVNIALVAKGRPLLGVVYAPVPGTLYVGLVGEGAYITRGKNSATAAETLGSEARDPETYWERLPQPRPEGSPLRVVASRSHGNEETETFIAALQAKHGTVERVSIGSSLKICLVAAGLADVYPRIAPTMEWDTAAAQAVLEAAGGRLVAYESDKPLAYNKENLLNPYFVAYRPGWEDDVRG